MTAIQLSYAQQLETTRHNAEQERSWEAQRGLYATEVKKNLAQAEVYNSQLNLLDSEVALNKENAKLSAAKTMSEYLNQGVTEATTKQKIINSAIDTTTSIIETVGGWFGF